VEEKILRYFAKREAPIKGWEGILWMERSSKNRYFTDSK